MINITSNTFDYSHLTSHSIRHLADIHWISLPPRTDATFHRRRDVAVQRHNSGSGGRPYAVYFSRRQIILISRLARSPTHHLTLPQKRWSLVSCILHVCSGFPLLQRWESRSGMSEIIESTNGSLGIRSYQTNQHS